MASLITGYEYDIFISYRQKDNKYDGWVTDFVDNLKRELEATFKEDISVYFDINPHDGLLETHEVADSLKGKLKCLVFIPIISRTYCDPKSFAWEHEFRAFIEEASRDQFGLKVKLPNGNVANRVLPVRIHDLDVNDIQLCESVLGGVLRGVEFIYKEPGVNRSLTPKDKEKKNLNSTIYRNQINKVALAIKEIILGMQTDPGLPVKEKAQKSELFGEEDKVRKLKGKKKTVKLNKRKLQTGVTILALLIIAAIFAWPRIFKHDAVEKLASSGEKIAVAVMPFQNLTNDTTLNIWQDGIQESLITSLSNIQELKIRHKESVKRLLQSNGLTEYASISPAISGTISEKLDADIFISGSIKQAGSLLRVDAQLIDSKTKDVLKSFEIDRPFKLEIFFDITDSLRKKITDFLLISKLIKENPGYERFPVSTNSFEAFRYYFYGGNSFSKGNWPGAIDWYLKALDVDSNYIDAMVSLSMAYGNQGMGEQSLNWILKLHRKRDNMSPIFQLWTDWQYASFFESLEVNIKILKQIQQIDDQAPDVYHILGIAYCNTGQYDKAILAYEKSLEIVSKWGKEFLKNNFVLPALGEAYHKTGQYKKEKRIYRKAELANDDHSSIYFSWIIRDQAALSLTLGDTVAANQYIKKFKSVLKENSSSNADITGGLALMYRQAEKPDKAEEYFRLALSLDTGNPSRMNTLACRLIERNKNFDEVIILLDKALELAQTKLEYYWYLDSKCWGLIKFGKNKEALDILEEAWKSAPLPYYFLKARLEEAKKAVAGQK